jgi:hypothetical protein
MYRIGPLLAGLLLAASCGPTYTLVEPTRTMIGSAYSVEPQIRWSASAASSISACEWTVDGYDIHRLRFVSAVKDREALSVGLAMRPRAAFRRGMTGIDIAEAYVDDLRLGGVMVEIGSVRLQRFGTADGFRFDLKIVSEDGLEGESIVVGTVLENKLYLIDYSAFGHYHFEKYKAVVERLIDSIQVQ